jgi:hypothetical protein
VKSEAVSAKWYLYEINDELGFVVPCELMNVNRVFGPKIIYNKF